MMEGDFSSLIRIILEHYPSVQGIYLFGSHGTEYERADSDMDIALLLAPLLAEQENSLSLSDFRIEIEKTYSKEVDLLNLRRVSTVI